MLRVSARGVKYSSIFTLLKDIFQVSVLYQGVSFPWLLVIIPILDHFVVVSFKIFAVLFIMYIKLILYSTLVTHTHTHPGGF